MDWYVDRFEREYKMARDEFLRLSALFKDVCWYNFETVCNTWKGPWRYSYPDSLVTLHGMRFRQHWLRGCLMEHGTFPMYYEGPVRDAPALPPQIVLEELMAAKVYMDRCNEERSAPLDWAPGGAKYKALVRTTLVGHKLPPVEQCLINKRKFSSVSANERFGAE